MAATRLFVFMRMEDERQGDREREKSDVHTLGVPDRKSVV